MNGHAIDDDEIPMILMVALPSHGFCKKDRVASSPLEMFRSIL